MLEELMIFAIGEIWKDWSLEVSMYPMTRLDKVVYLVGRYHVDGYLQQCLVNALVTDFSIVVEVNLTCNVSAIDIVENLILLDVNNRGVGDGVRMDMEVQTFEIVTFLALAGYVREGAIDFE